MSWFSSVWSSVTSIIPPPADSLHPHPRGPVPSHAAPKHTRKLLEEPSSSTRPSPVDISSSNFDIRTLPEYERLQEEGRRRNKLIFFGGLAFFGLAVFSTRRSLTRRKIASAPGKFSALPEHNAELSKSTNGALEAVQALQIATINVLSVAMAAVGGTLWYLDVNTMADARRMVRGGLGVDGTGKTEQEAEEEFEEFVATVLQRKEDKQTARAKREA